MRLINHYKSQVLIYPNRYNETVFEYTENGAIKRFLRRVLKQDNVYGKIDNLNISLDGNRVVHVVDDALPVERKGAVDFTDSSERQTEYTYNSDGALTGDANRGIAKIDYDACGYPRRVQFMDGSVTEYVYTVTGMKLRTVHRTAVPGISVAFGQTRELTEGETLNADSTDYLGNLILEDGEPSKYLFGGGYCSFDGDGISYHYYDRDHQGNIRAVVNSDGTVEQIMNYYPFGTPFSDNTAMNPDYQPYKYNGKEFEAMHGRNAYDYGARFYDPLLPAWDRMDPLCEKYYHVSPYAYCANDPVNLVDLDGMDIYPVYFSEKDNDGYFIGTPYVSSLKYIRAMTKFGKTSYGKKFISSFLKKGENQYGVTGTGLYSKYRFSIYQNNYDNTIDQLGAIGNSYGKFYVKETDGQLDIVMELDIKNQEEGELIETIMHELIIHGSKIDTIINAYERGGMDAVKDVFSKDPGGEKEHSDLYNKNINAPNVRNYMRAKKELLDIYPYLENYFK